MNERMWLASKETWDMLEFLKDKASKRKLRLFAVACCRRMWQWFRFDECRNAVLIAEEFAAGKRTVLELTSARSIAETFLDPYVEKPEGAAVQASWIDIGETVSECAITAEAFCPAMGNGPFGSGRFLEPSEEAMEEERIKQSDLIRDIFGNPFCAVTVVPAWQIKNVTAVAQSIYYERRFEDMPTLADALEEAGCTNANILDHCRGPGEHVRGCWVVDLILGKE